MYPMHLRLMPIAETIDLDLYQLESKRSASLEYLTVMANWFTIHRPLHQDGMVLTMENQCRLALMFGL